MGRLKAAADRAQDVEDRHCVVLEQHQIKVDALNCTIRGFTEQPNDDQTTVIKPKNQIQEGEAFTHYNILQITKLAIYNSRPILLNNIITKNCYTLNYYCNIIRRYNYLVAQCFISSADMLMLSISRSM